MGLTMDYIQLTLGLSKARYEQLVDKEISVRSVGHKMDSDLGF